MRHACTTHPKVTCCNHDCLKGRACALRPQRAPWCPARATVWRLAILGTAAFWLLLYALVPWSSVFTWIWHVLQQHSLLIAVALVVCVMVGVAIGMLYGLFDRYMPPEEGDTHAGFPPPTRTADAGVIERQTTALLRRAQQQARQQQEAR